MGLCPSCHGCTKYRGGLVFSGFSACMLYDCADTCNEYAAWLERKRVRHEKAVALWKEHTEKLRRNKMTRFLDGCSFQEPAWAKTTFGAEYALGWRLLEDRNNKVWNWVHPTKTGVVSVGAIVRPTETIKSGIGYIPRRRVLFRSERSFARKLKKTAPDTATARTLVQVRDSMH